MLFYERSEAFEPVDQAATPIPYSSQATSEAMLPQAQQATAMQPQEASPRQSQQGISEQPQAGSPSQPQQGLTGQTQEDGSKQFSDAVMLAQGQQSPVRAESVSEQPHPAPSDTQDEDRSTLQGSPQLLHSSTSPAGTLAPLSNVSPLKVCFCHAATVSEQGQRQLDYLGAGC